MDREMVGSVLLPEPMLASTNSRLVEVPEGWVAEPKLDGWRGVVAVQQGGLIVRSRRGSVLTNQVPELAGLVEAVPDGTVLDGEIVAGAGRMTDFYGLAPRLLARSPAARERWAHVALSFQAFDVIHLGGEDLSNAPWSERRARLEQLDLAVRCWATVPLLDGSLQDLLASCAALDLEGVVLKDRKSTYRPGERTKLWVKVKVPGWREHHARRGEFRT